MFKKLGLYLKWVFTPKAPKDTQVARTPSLWFIYEPKAPKNV